MAIKVSYNGVDFPATVRPMSVGMGVDLGEVELPRRDGAATQSGRVKGRVLRMRGALQEDDPVALQASYDALKTACFAGSRVAKALHFGADDRYINAQLQEWSDDFALGEQSGIGYRVNVSLAFFAGDPFWYAADAANVALGVGGTATAVPVGGDAPASPVWTMAVRTGGSGMVSVGNAATAETAIVAGTFAAGDAIALDYANYMLTVNGTARFGWLSGRIPSLAAGENSVTVGSAGVGLGSAGVVFAVRWA